MKHNAIQHLIVSNRISHKKQNIAEILKDYFLTTADSINNQVINDNIDDNTPNIDNENIMSHLSQAYSKNYLPVYSKPSATQEIENIIHSLKTMNSCRYGEISTEILELSLPFISSAMNFECNRILFTGKFPDSLKYYTVKPLHKKGNKQEISNYTLISLSTFYSIIGEKVIHTRLMSHLTKYIIFEFRTIWC